MNDSGFSGLPPGPRTGASSFPPSRAELKAEIVQVRGELKVQRSREKMEGEIVRHNRDGTTTIRTEKGEAKVRFRSRERPPEGTRVQLDVPPGSPPRQLTVRPAPDTPEQTPPARPAATPVSRSDTATAPPTQTPAPQGTPPPSAPPPPLSTQTLENITQRLTTPANRAERVPQVTIEPGTIVRLTPLPLQTPPPPVLETITAKPAAVSPPLPQSTISTPATVPSLLSTTATLPAQPTVTAAAGTEVTAPIPIISPATSGLPGIPAEPIVNILTQSLTAITPPPLPLPVAAAAVTSPLTGSVTTPAPAGEQAVLPPSPDILTQSVRPFDARITSITSPPVPVFASGALPPSPAATADDNQQTPLRAGDITGRIVTHTPQNLPVISFLFTGQDTPQNFILSAGGADLPPGTQIQMTPLPTSTGNVAATGTATAPFIPAAFFSNFSWPAMDELYQTLQQAAPQAAQALTNMSASPATPNRLPAMALFFIAAVRSGDIGSWLGDKTADTLRRLGRGDIINRLTRDASGLQRTASEPAAQDWRALALPMAAEGEIHKLMLYYRHDRAPDRDDDDEKTGTRFIFDLSLSRMGPVQLDGLHRPQNNGGRLDLIVRTHDQISAGMQQYMRRLYTDALAQAALGGELSFQHQAETFIKIEMPATTGDSRA